MFVTVDFKGSMNICVHVSAHFSEGLHRRPGPTCNEGSASQAWPHFSLNHAIWAQPAPGPMKWPQAQPFREAGEATCAKMYAAAGRVADSSGLFVKRNTFSIGRNPKACQAARSCAPLDAPRALSEEASDSDAPAAAPVALPPDMPRSLQLADLASWVVAESAHSHCVDMEVARKTLDGRHWTMFSMCSGTEYQGVCGKRLSECLQRQGIDCSISLIASCEFADKKCRWIAKKYGVEHPIFKDITKLGLTQAHVFGSSEPREVPSADVVVAGISCKAMSRRNKDRKKFVAAMAKGNYAEGGCTGSHLQGLLAYLSKHSGVKLVIIENVAALLDRTPDGSPFDKIKASLEELGFTVGHSPSVPS